MEEVLEFEAFPGRKLTVMLFKDVSNCPALVEQLLAGTLTPEMSLIDATRIPSLLPLSIAAHKALSSLERGKLTTRTLHSELVYNCSGSKHITESLRRFGIPAEGCAHLLAARFDATQDEAAAIRRAVSGSEHPLSELPPLVDTKALAKIIKATPSELEAGGLVDALCSRIAARDCM